MVSASGVFRIIERGQRLSAESAREVGAGGVSLLRKFLRRDMEMVVERVEWKEWNEIGNK